MKQPVILSAFCNIVSYGVLIALAIGCVCTWSDPVKFWLLCGITFVLLACGMWWGPVSVTAADGALSVLRVIGRRRVIPYSDIVSIEVYQPTMGTRRVCGSGGFMGYWGWFREYNGAELYFAYYGRSSDCFLVTLRDGKRYVIGCREPQTIIDAVRTALEA